MNKSYEFHNNLVELCKKKDRTAQQELYKIYARRMFNTSLRIVKNTMNAEDVVHDAFIAAFLAIHQYKGEVPFSAWLRRIVINKSIDFLRKNKYAYYEPQEIVNNIDLDETNDPEDLKVFSNRLEHVKREILNLPDGYRIIFSLFYLEGYDHEEISHILGISASTSRSQLTRAKQMLIRKLNADKS